MGIKDLINDLLGRGHGEPKKELPAGEFATQMQDFIRVEIASQIRKVLGEEVLPVILKQVEDEFNSRDQLMENEIKKVLREDVLPYLKKHYDYDLNKLETTISGEFKRIMRDEFSSSIQQRIATEFSNRAAAESDEIHRIFREEFLPEIQARIETELNGKKVVLTDESYAAPDVLIPAQAPVDFSEEFPEILAEPVESSELPGEAPFTLEVDQEDISGQPQFEVLVTDLPGLELITEPELDEGEEIFQPDESIEDGEESFPSLGEIIEGNNVILPLVDDDETEISPAFPDSVDADPTIQFPAEIIEDETDRPEEANKPRKLKSLLEANLRLGIDFGTSTTAVSVKMGDTLSSLAPIGSIGSLDYIPSVVYISPGDTEIRERILVGEEAENQANETYKIRSVKRCFGCDKSSGCAVIRNASGQERSSACAIDRAQPGAQTPLTPGQIAYFIVYEALNKTVTWLRETKGIDITMENMGQIQLNLGCGVNFSLKQRTVLIDIGRQLGFKEITIGNIIEEPVLAGFAFARYAKEPHGISLLYDFGGGTLDVAVIDVNEDDNPQITVISTTGDNWLGGDDIDTLVYNNFIDQIADSNKMSSQQVLKSLTYIDAVKLKIMAKKAKERLSSHEEFIDNFYPNGMKEIRLELDRIEFESLLAESGLVEKSMLQVLEALKITQALKQAALSDDLGYLLAETSRRQAGKVVDRVILVGGVTNIPYILRQLIDVFGEEKIVDQTIINPTAAVAIGASYPKEKQHFSIANPPYSFNKKFIGGEKPRTHIYEPISAAYQHFSFFEKIIKGKLPTHGMTLSIPYDAVDVSVVLLSATTGQEFELFSVDNRVRSNFFLEVSLDGYVAMSSGSMNFPPGRLPLTHPLQDQIFKKRLEREEHSRLKLPDSTAFGDMSGMTLEN